MFNSWGYKSKSFQNYILTISEDDALTDQVFTQEPYASKGQRNRLNSSDNIYNEHLLAAAQADEGYAATFDIGLQMA